MKRFGYGHDTDTKPGNGDLADFCPACPQPGFNVELEWYPQDQSVLFINFLIETNPDISSPWLRRRILVTDGNFKADHMKMRRPELDVVLTDGEGYFVEEAPYQEHLRDFQDIRQVSSNAFLNFLV